MNAKELIEEIQAEKKTAIKEGTLREEKPLEPIADRDIPRRLPEGWEWCRLGDYAMKVTDYVASGSFASLKENVLITNDENYAVMVKTADFSNGFSKNLTYTDEHGYKFLENSNLYGGELILSNIGSIGKVFIVPDLKRPMTLASNTVMVRMTHNEYNKYMYYMFKSPFGQGLLMSISSGTSMLKFNKTQLKSTIIPIAPLEEQYRICDVLDKVQGVIDKRERELVDLDNLIKARFVELFGNPVINDKGWNTDFCKNLMSKIGSGATPKGGRESYCDEGISLIRSMNVYNNRFEYKDLAHITDEQAEQLDNVTIEKSDVLLNITGASVARCCVVPDDLLPARVNQHVSIIRCKESLLPEFVCSMFTEDNYQRLLWNIATAGGATREAITKQQIEDLQLIVPPLDIQKQFMDFVKQVDKSKVKVQKSLDETRLLFDSMMQEFFG